MNAMSGQENLPASILNDVQFDQALAAEAITALQTAARLLDQYNTQRASLANQARQDWNGWSRHTFDGFYREMMNAGASLVQDLLSTAAAISVAMREASLEQKRRDEQRQQDDQARARLEAKLAQQRIDQMARHHDF